MLSIKALEHAAPEVAVPVTDGEDSVDFVTWYATEHPRLLGVLTRLGDVGDAADLAAEAFSRAWERWDQVAQMRSPTGWVFQVAFNLRRRRGRQAHGSTIIPAANAVDPMSHGSDVWDAVRRLPDRQRTAIVLHYVLDLAYVNVAEVMGITVGTVGATLTKARAKLALELPAATGAGSSDG